MASSLALRVSELLKNVINKFTRITYDLRYQ